MTVSLILAVVTTLLVAFYGRQTRLGFWGILILSCFITPVPIFLALLLLNIGQTGSARVKTKFFAL